MRSCSRLSRPAWYSFCDTDFGKLATASIIDFKDGCWSRDFVSDKEQATTFIEVDTGHHADSAACRVDESADMVLIPAASVRSFSRRSRARSAL
jgi:hypothetical protein